MDYKEETFEGEKEREIREESNCHSSPPVTHPLLAFLTNSFKHLLHADQIRQPWNKADSR